MGKFEFADKLTELGYSREEIGLLDNIAYECSQQAVVSDWWVRAMLLEIVRDDLKQSIEDVSAKLYQEVN